MLETVSCLRPANVQPPNNCARFANAPDTLFIATGKRNTMDQELADSYANAIAYKRIGSLAPIDELLRGTQTSFREGRSLLGYSTPTVILD